MGLPYHRNLWSDFPVIQIDESTRIRSRVPSETATTGGGTEGRHGVPHTGLTETGDTEVGLVGTDGVTTPHGPDGPSVEDGEGRVGGGRPTVRDALRDGTPRPLSPTTEVDLN